MTDLLRPLADARLVLALAILGCATALLWVDKIDPSYWAGAIGAATVWLTAAPRGQGVDTIAKGRQL